MTHAPLPPVTARKLIGFFSRNIPMLDQNGDWHHMHITAYQIACEALAALGHAEETEWGARPVADPHLPAAMPRWDDICIAVLKMARQLNLISYRHSDGLGATPHVTRDLVRPQTAQPPSNIAAASGLGAACAAPELMPILQMLGLVDAGRWAAPAELVYWREQPDAWQLEVATDTRFITAVEQAASTIPDDAHAELDMLANIDDADVARLLARQMPRQMRLEAEAGPDSRALPPLTSETVRNRMVFTRSHSMDLFFLRQLADTARLAGASGTCARAVHLSRSARGDDALCRHGTAASGPTLVFGSVNGGIKMKILVLADLHVDEITDPEYLHRLGVAIQDAGKGADAMIVAGDLTEHAAEKWPTALRWLGTHYPLSKTAIFPGNHDYYGGNLSTLDAQLDQICHDAGCSFGQCKRLVLGDVRVLMTTLWTDLRLFEDYDGHSVEDSIWHAQMMPDYGEVITVTEEEWPLRPEDTIVVTHHAPSGSVAGEMTPLSPCFSSDLEAEIERYRPDIWLFGHTHRSAEKRMPGGTLLRNVSIGYEDELHHVELEQRVRRGLIDLGPVLRADA